jgi:hypothetical protein
MTLLSSYSAVVSFNMRRRRVACCTHKCKKPIAKLHRNTEVQVSGELPDMALDTGNCI